jgi:hypothetical protein
MLELAVELVPTEWSEEEREAPVRVVWAGSMSMSSSDADVRSFLNDLDSLSELFVSFWLDSLLLLLGMSLFLLTLRTHFSLNKVSSKYLTTILYF